MNTSKEDFGGGKGERNEMPFSVIVKTYCQMSIKYQLP
jgi:hypothetical protein